MAARRRAGRWLALVALVLTAPVIAFLLAAWGGSSIARNGDWQQSDTGIEILVGDNGVHTEIVMPILAAGHDWRSVFPPGDIENARRAYSHVGVSWGERTFFLETPTWADLEAGNAIGAITGGDALLHVAWYVRPAPSEDYRPLRLAPEEYRRLARSIAADLAPGGDQFPGYGAHDVFYAARGRYHLARTCNQWTSDRLAGAGVTTGWWTPFAGGVMKWIARPPER